MKNLFLIMIMVVSVTFFVGCDYDDDYTPPNYVTFESAQGDIGVEAGESGTYEIVVYSANVVGQDRNIDVVVGEKSTLASDSYSVPATVTIPANSNEGVLTVQLTDENIELAGDNLILSMIPAGDLSTGDPFVLNVRENCPVGTGEVVVSLVFDGYASETTWEISDDSGDVVYSGGGYADGDESASSIVCLSAGDYEFTVYDVYGDGLSYPADGKVTVTTNGTQLVSIKGDFGFDETASFSITDVR